MDKSLLHSLQILENFLNELCQIRVVFRLDDVGLESKSLLSVLKLFVSSNIPINLAVIPAIFDRLQLAEIDKLTTHKTLFCWCQHGFAHVNYEPAGSKKSEFGATRSKLEKVKDILAGQRIMSNLLMDRFSKIFVPPWNKMDQQTVDILCKLKYKGISQFNNKNDTTWYTSRSLDMNVDLHTCPTVEHLSSTGIETMCHVGRSGYLGIMLHHTKMTDRDFIFLSYLLNILKRTKSVQFLTFDEVLTL